jgi:hypothetical protein
VPTSRIVPLVPDEPLVPRDDLHATIEARRELGPSHDAELVDAFVERIEQRLAKGPSSSPARRGGREGSFTLAVVSMGVGIPLTAIALSNGGLAALLIVWIGIVFVNAAYHRS